VAAIRITLEAEVGATVFYFMDLAWGVERLIFENRRIDTVDYVFDGSFILYSAMVPRTTEEDLFFSRFDGTEEQNLTESTSFRERSPRVDPSSPPPPSTRDDESGRGRIYLFSRPAHDGPGAGVLDTPYVGRDADPVFARRAVHRVPRLTAGQRRPRNVDSPLRSTGTREPGHRHRRSSGSPD
jgi:hypothetical protein